MRSSNKYKSDIFSLGTKEWNYILDYIPDIEKSSILSELLICNKLLNKNITNLIKNISGNASLILDMIKCNVFVPYIEEINLIGIKLYDWNNSDEFYKLTNITKRNYKTALRSIKKVTISYCEIPWDLKEYRFWSEWLTYIANTEHITLQYCKFYSKMKDRNINSNNNNEANINSEFDHFNGSQNFNKKRKILDYEYRDSTIYNYTDTVQCKNGYFPIYNLLRSCKYLKELRIVDTNININQISDLLKWLQEFNAKLHALNIDRNILIFGNIISSAITGNKLIKYLKYLSLSSTKLNDEDAFSILTSFIKDKQEINMKDNDNSRLDHSKIKISFSDNFLTNEFCNKLQKYTWDKTLNFIQEVRIDISGNPILNNKIDQTCKYIPKWLILEYNDLLPVFMGNDLQLPSSTIEYNEYLFNQFNILKKVETPNTLLNIVDEDYDSEEDEDYSLNSQESSENESISSCYSNSENGNSVDDSKCNSIHNYRSSDDKSDESGDINNYENNKDYKHN
ncbi:uncharacterized protein CMU_027920 [Cryptosporidium muris RN66]|uniref:Uncharacterized protein n=1 Tax=Cryptosporidium muris (strain RN66) TaxID=441375 RepID=B6ABN0_CRYMR|nr:uncharacterized protein CMU_027920 [Cryptosporidium muris RN66]EEA05782.1 hypothetical protein CMU_027920 [Cryptosporidium muris RN66]|eukprot:XP_002140131.1 hypothetical protein [Cryptosporidium muris RN66]